ncbi:MAG: DNA-processing protein DprA, partial [Nitrososphaerota archaeon]|nr:DNA-processing protein DprA [Nitrososphaerota archaeon]
MTCSAEFDWFRLSRTRGVGPASIWDIYEIIARENLSLSDFMTQLQNNPAKLSSKNIKKLLGLVNQDIRDYEDARNLYKKLKQGNVQIINPESHLYPTRLKGYIQKYELRRDIPPILYAKGNLHLLSAPASIAIVGSRNVGDEVTQVALELSKGLAKAGFNIISGYAKGVDSAAHLGALKAGGTTTIVLSLGILQFQPKDEFKNLFSSSVQSYLILSQFDPHEKWLARNAMARNRLVCALSDAVLVIASGKKIEYKDGREVMSGTFNAAEVAREMNIPVFVLSPHLFSQPPAGNADLIHLGCR